MKKLIIGLVCVMVVTWLFLVLVNQGANKMLKVDVSKFPAAWATRFQPQDGKHEINNVWWSEKELAENSQTVFVFVHGIFSDSRKCWWYLKNGPEPADVVWPDLIERDKKHFSGVSVFLGGYHADWTVHNYDIPQCADELFLGLSRPNDLGKSPLDKKRIVFICHSLGGVVVRQMLVDPSKLPLFQTKQVGLVLIASPSSGADLASVFRSLASLYG